MARTLRLAALAAALAVAGCGGGGPGTGPAADDATVSQRVVDYFRKSVATPGLSLEVSKLEPSEVPGFRKGNLQVSLGQQSQDVAFYVSTDGRFLFRGDAVDLTVDPLAQVMNRITLDGEPARGPKDARVTIVEYSDFQCPFCARAYATFEEEVMKEYGDRVRFVFKHYPLSFHAWAEDGAVAAECAARQGGDQFWAMYRGLFEKQQEITKDNLEAKAAEIARGAGVDADDLAACLDGRQTLDSVKADVAEAEALGVDSTPTFFVNGRRLKGAQTFEGFKQIIDQELAGKG